MVLEYPVFLEFLSIRKQNFHQSRPPILDEDYLWFYKKIYGNLMPLLTS